MKIEKLYNDGKLSVRAYNVCMKNNIISTYDLEQFYKTESSFLKLRNCGAKSNDELIKIVNAQDDIISQIISNLSPDEKEKINTYILELWQSMEQRSKRFISNYLNNRLNIDEINKSELLSSKELFKYNTTKTAEEIHVFTTEIRLLLTGGTHTTDEAPEAEEVVFDITALSRLQREVINNYIFVNTESLSVRSKNAIENYLRHNLKIKNFIERVLSNKQFDVNNIRNVGAKSIKELSKYISDIEDFYHNVRSLTDENEILRLKNSYLIQRNFEIKDIPIEIQYTDSIFKLTEYLIDNNCFFNSVQTLIIKKSINLYQDTDIKSLDDIANQLDLTRERVRQLRVSGLESLFERLKFLNNIKDDLYQKYGIDTSNEYICVDDEMCDLINYTNDTNFSKEFIKCILSVYFLDDISLIGNIDDVLVPKPFNNRKRHNWKSLFLLKNSIKNIFDFNGFVDNVQQRVDSRIEETYSFNLKSFISNHIKDYSIENIYILSPICEEIINEEFGIYLDLDENITFERNTLKLVTEFIEEALEAIGKPSKVAEIYSWINKRYPNVSKNEEALRGSCQRNSNLMYIGRSSTYALKKWEETKKNIKGGTIKNIVIELLEEACTPLHIYEICQELNKYRSNITEKNVITNLKLDPYNSFIFYNQKFIGLSTKEEFYDKTKYDNIPIQLGKKIIGKLKKNPKTTSEQLDDFLRLNYKLTSKEVRNILSSLNISI